jgi:xanthine dehydrogenase molybdopterin-binding subunit B
MTFSSASLIRHLQDLAQQITAAPQHTEALHTALQGSSIAHAFATRLEANRHVCAMATTVAHIKAEIVPGDGLGATVESISELVLRGQRKIVLAELDALREIASEPATRSRLTALAFSPFEDLEDWISYVGHEVNGVSQWWIDYRGQADERAEYRAALGKAHAAMRHLAERSKATPFLLDAVVRTDWPALQAPCSRISAALTVPIDVDPDMPVVVISPRSPELVTGRPS